MLVLGACTAPPESPSREAPRDLVRVDRPGYTIPPGSAIADPAALVSGSAGDPVIHGGRPVVQACSVVTPQGLREAGMLLWPNPLAGAVERTYFDGQSKERLPVSGYVLPASGGNECLYTLELGGGDRGAVTVSVHQTTYASPTAMNLQQRRYRPASLELDGVEVLTRSDSSGDPAVGRYALPHKDALVELRVEHPSEERRAALLRVAARQLDALTRQPAGPSEFRYDSPAFTGDVANGCRLAGADTFRAMFGVQPSPLVTEHVASAVGVVDSKTVGEVNYVDHACIRRSVGETLADTDALEIEVRTYEAAAAAEASFAFDRERAQGVVDVADTGDEAFYAGSRLDGDDGTLAFRKGRAVVVAGFYIRAKRAGSAQERLRRLLPVAQAVAERMTAF